MKENYNSELDFILIKLIEAHEKDPKFKGFKDAFGTEEQKTHNVIAKELKNKYYLENWQLYMLFEQLQKDDFIYKVDPLNITLKGALFIGNGGFTNKKRKDNLVTALKYAQTIALFIFSFGGFVWAVLQVLDRIGKCCGCHH